MYGQKQYLLEPRKFEYSLIFCRTIIHILQAIGAGCVQALQSYEEVLNALPEKVVFTRHSDFVPSFLEE